MDHRHVFPGFRRSQHKEKHPAGILNGLKKALCIEKEDESSLPLCSVSTTTCHLDRRERS